MELPVLSQVLRALRAAVPAGMPVFAPLERDGSRQGVAVPRAWGAEAVALPGVGLGAAL